MEITAVIYLMTMILLTLVYVGLVAWLWTGLRRLKNPVGSSEVTASIIVSMHNEAHNVKACLEALHRQQYPRDKFEIIIINDRSTDKTNTNLAAYASEENVRIIEISKTLSGFAPKKYAIDQGIKSASGDIILLTDADGRPGPQWIRSMTAAFDDETGMVLGYAPYTVSNPLKPLIKRILALEYFSHAAIAAASCGNGFPLTAVGTNLAYRKAVYQELDGYGKYRGYHSGDDDLFMQRVRDETKWKIKYNPDAESHVYNDPPATVRDFYHQRLRYASKALFYPSGVILGMGMFYLLYLCLFLSPFLWYFFGASLITFFTVLIMTFTADFSFLARAGTVLNDRRFLSCFPILFFLHIPYVLFFSTAAQLRPFHWKGKTQKKQHVLQNPV